MKLLDLNELTRGNSYPGRGIVLGVSQDGTNAVAAYFIMGRSENSRNRIFVKTDDGIETKAYDESKMVDPSLIIYAPVRKLNEQLIVTNGDQTDTVYNYLAAGKTFEAALRTRTFEPDAPNFTPRISGLMTRQGNQIAYQLSILKSNNGDDTSTQRFFFDYNTPSKGEGHFIHTYQCDGNPIPSFEGEPERIKLTGDVDTFTRMLWSSLNEENKVSLYVSYWNMETGKMDTRIINKHQ